MPEWKHWERYEELYGCDHSQTIATQYTKNNGVVCVALQCKKCGEKTREVRKADYDLSKIPKFGETFRDKMRALADERRNALREQWEQENKREYETKQGAENLAYWRKYNDYLRTEHWQKIRRRVLVRDGFLCQNCFCKITESNFHAHHISYKAYNKLGYSFAFEVVSLCRPCHEDVHRSEQ